MKNDKQPNDSVMELLELSSVNSPFTSTLLANYRKRLVQRLLKGNKIDPQTAQALLN